MRPHAERKAETERLMTLLPAVEAELMRIPGVSAVSVGIRERGGELTDEIVFRVHVDAKIPESALPHEQVVPKAIHGVPTDVIVKRMPVLETGFNDDNDEKHYSTLVGGVSISPRGDSDRPGTLGCFCRRIADGKTVLLTNTHVLIGDPVTGKIGDGVGNPRWRKSCCCVCDRVATILDFKPDPLDCAIAEIDPGVKAAYKVRRILRPDNTVEEEGRISGSGVPIPGDEVYKVGWRTGLTRGMITGLKPNQVEVSPKAPFTRMSKPGDSGSVYISSLTGNVVVLHNSGDGTRGFGIPFNEVKAALGIEVIDTPDDTSFAVIDLVDRRGARVAEPPFQALAEKLQQSPAGETLLRLMSEHRDEVMKLVNSRRRFTVAWQRSQGPAFLAALTRSAQDPDYRIPPSIRGISRRDATHHIEAAMRATGSPQLLRDIDEFGAALANALNQGDSVDEVLGSWETARLEALR